MAFKPKWRDVYPFLKTMKQEYLVEIAMGWFKSIGPTADMIDIVARQNWQGAARIRRNSADAREREIAHIAIHLVFAMTSSDIVSTAGHVARCYESAYKLNPKVEL